MCVANDKAKKIQGFGRVLMVKEQRERLVESGEGDGDKEEVFGHCGSKY